MQGPKIQIIHNWGGKTIDTNSKFKHGISACTKYGSVECEVYSLQTKKSTVYARLKIFAVPKDDGGSAPMEVKFTLAMEHVENKIPLQNNNSASFNVGIIKKQKDQALPPIDTLNFYFAVALMDSQGGILGNAEDTRHVFNVISIKRGHKKQHIENEVPASKRQKHASEKNQEIYDPLTEIQQLRQQMFELQKNITLLFTLLAPLLSSPSLSPTITPQPTLLANEITLPLSLLPDNSQKYFTTKFSFSPS